VNKPSKQIIVAVSCSLLCSTMVGAAPPHRTITIPARALQHAEILLPPLEDILLVNPMEGENLVDYAIVNHVDHDDGVDQLLDYMCYERTYDGHQGTDFVLRGFHQMDEGGDIYATADGQVITVVDHLFDRNKEKNDEGFGNYIAIYHPQGFYTYSAHIRTDSALVEVGDWVTAGQPIAQVASSGNSTDPHLHLEIWYPGVLVDPYLGPCGEDLAI